MRVDHCVLWQRYNPMQGLLILLPQQIRGRSIVGTLSHKARGGIQWISETGSGGAVSNVIVSPIGANNLTPGPVQSEVELEPLVAYSLGIVLLREPLPFAEILEAGNCRPPNG